MKVISLLDFHLLLDWYVVVLLDHHIISLHLILQLALYLDQAMIFLLQIQSNLIWPLIF